MYKGKSIPIPKSVDCLCYNERKSGLPKDGKPKREDTAINRKELLRVIKFTLFSISAGVIEIVSFTLLNELTPMPYWPCYLIALVLSVLWNFTFNRRFTFRSAGNIPRAMALVALYYCVFTPVSTLAGNALASAGWNEYLVTALNMVANFVTEYLYDSFVVFRGTVDSNDLAKKDSLNG